MTAKRADAAATGLVPTPVHETTAKVIPPPLRRAVRVAELPRLYDLDPYGPDPEPGRGIEPAATRLELTDEEAGHLRSILRESIAGDLDLIEDTLYQTALVDEDAVARTALAIRLEAALG